MFKFLALKKTCTKILCISKKNGIKKKKQKKKKPRKTMKN